MIGFGCLHRSWPVAPFRGRPMCVRKGTPRIILTSMFHPFTALSLAQACPQPCMCQAPETLVPAQAPCLPVSWSAQAQLPAGALQLLSSSSWANCSITPCPLAAFFASSLGNLGLGAGITWLPSVSGACLLLNAPACSKCPRLEASDGRGCRRHFLTRSGLAPLFPNCSLSASFCCLWASDAKEAPG